MLAEMTSNPSVTEILSKAKELEAEIIPVIASLDNIQRRRYYGKVELLKLDIIGCSENTEALQLLDKLSAKLNVIPYPKAFGVFSWPETCIRFLGVCGSFILVGSICSLPLLLMRAIDKFLNMDPFEYYSEYFKRMIAWLFILQSGIVVETIGLEKSFFQAPCVLLTFNHSSNLDGFLVSGTGPIQQLAFGKKELFVVPFFSWISLAFGGVPVDRGNRDRAVSALKRSVDSAKKAKISIAIAPEGTRSTTGQLLPFKKGTVYMWDELRSPIVPMIIYGAYDLYPVGNWVNQTGHVTVKYLPPIQPSEAPDKEAMLVLVRRRMLEALMDCPQSIKKPISPLYWVGSLLLNVFILLLNYTLAKASYYLLITRWSLSTGTIVFWFVTVTLAITAALYVYYVYLIDLGKTTPTSKGKKNTKKSA